MEHNSPNCRSALILIVPISPKKKKKVWVNRGLRTQKCYYYCRTHRFSRFYTFFTHAFTLISTVPPIYYTTSVPSATHRPCITYSTIVYKIPPTYLFVNFRFAIVNERLAKFSVGKQCVYSKNAVLSADLGDLGRSRRTSLLFSRLRLIHKYARRRNFWENFGKIVLADFLLWRHLWRHENRPCSIFWPKTCVKRKNSAKNLVHSTRRVFWEVKSEKIGLR